MLQVKSNANNELKNAMYSCKQCFSVLKTQYKIKGSFVREYLNYLGYTASEVDAFDWQVWQPDVKASKLGFYSPWAVLNALAKNANATKNFTESKRKAAEKREADEAQIKAEKQAAKAAKTESKAA